MAAPRTIKTEDPALGAAQLLVRLGVALLAIAVPCGAVGSRRLIFTLVPVGAALLIIGGMLAPGSGRPHWRRVLLEPAGLTAMFLVGWMCLSLIWTPYVATGSERFFKTAGTVALAIAAAILLPDRTKTSNLYLLPIGIGAGAVATILVALLAPSAGGARSIDIEGSTVDREAVGLIMLVWPALGALAVRERWASAGVLAVFVGLAAILTWNPVAILAMALGALTFVLAIRKLRQTALVLAGIAGVLFAGAPLLAIGFGAVGAKLNVNPEGFLGFATIWGDLMKHEGLRLLTGHGIDATARGISSGFLSPQIPRTILLEVWYDLGVIGALAAAVLAARAMIAASHVSEPLGPFVLSTLVCGLTIAISGISTGQLWWVSLLAVVGIAYGLVINGQYRTERPHLSSSEARRLSTA